MIEQADIVAPAPVQRLAEILRRPRTVPMLTLPPLWHWLYCLGDSRPAGSVLIGGEVSLQRPIELFAALTKQTERCSDSAGEVKMRHVWRVGEAQVATETERWGAPRSGKPAGGLSAAASCARVITSDEVMRFAAVTYDVDPRYFDRDWAGAPEVRRWAPTRLVALLLLELLHREQPASQVRRFSFRLLQPAYEDEPLTLAFAAEGLRARLQACAADGSAVMCAAADTVL
ncbi:conserved hypothetical protein [Phenylobacterium zucineum HLK1]|uniref:Acyl dehydratase n=1 Tax=Phenylobacterium zucineum (strain HLK1) TaxID=450851 RepID=B4RH27_PHEZH|nr:hypothetical protein [Phenylobacterium zucineum]ACG78975.1 conserved hypothetical protein [Phenylobacterium zucineum HLK1]